MELKARDLRSSENDVYALDGGLGSGAAARVRGDLRAQSAEVAELVGAGGDGTLFGRIESLLLRVAADDAWVRNLRARTRSNIPGPLMVDDSPDGPVGVSEYQIIVRLLGYIAAQQWDAECDRLEGLEAEVARLRAVLASGRGADPVPGAIDADPPDNESLDRARVEPPLAPPGGVGAPPGVTPPDDLAALRVPLRVGGS